MSPTRAELVDALEAATSTAVTRLFREHADEHFYYLALVTTGEGLAPVLSAWSTEALDEAVEAAQTPDARAQLEWSYADSPFHAYGEDLFVEVRRLFARVDAGYEFCIAVMVEAVERLDRSGLFGTGDARARLLVNVEVAPPDHTNTDRARLLNPPGMFERWARVAAEPEPEASPPRTLVRIFWHGGRPTSADVRWVRSVSPLVVGAPLHLVSQHLRTHADFALGWYRAERALSIRVEAEQRGHQVELLSYDDYGARYIEHALECPPLLDEELRVIFEPSMSREGVITARRTSSEWAFEARMSREFLARRFRAVGWEEWDEIEPRSGFEVIGGMMSREELREAEEALTGRPTPASSAPPGMIGADGITVHVASRLAGAAFEEEAWSPQQGTRGRAAVDLTLALLRAHSTQWSNAFVGYFD